MTKFWRGAEIRNILEFEKTYPDAKIIRLETNYRSSGNILGAANSLIKNNMGRLGKDLRTAPGVDDGEPVYVKEFNTGREEAFSIVETIARNANNKFSSFVVLIRAGSLSRVFEEAFSLLHVPYRLIGTKKFYERTEIRDVIAYVRLLVYPFDDISFERIISKPSRKIGPSAIAKLRESGKSLMDALKITKLSSKQEASANEFLSAFDFDWQSMAPKDAVRQLLENSGYLKMWYESKDADAEERLKRINDFIFEVVARYDTLPEFLEQVALITTDDDDTEADKKNVVTVMTIHAAKGLEFDTVFLPAWEEGIFPSKNKSHSDIEEERRLAYVAITRARKRAIITYARNRVLFGQMTEQIASRFIGEIDKKYVNGKSESIIGKLVSHTEMGTGVIIAENDKTLTVAFKTRGIKNVARDFVKFI